MGEGAGSPPRACEQSPRALGIVALSGGEALAAVGCCLVMPLAPAAYVALAAALPLAAAWAACAGGGLRAEADEDGEQVGMARAFRSAAYGREARRLAQLALMATAVGLLNEVGHTFFQQGTSQDARLVLLGQSLVAVFGLALCWAFGSLLFKEGRGPAAYRLLGIILIASAFAAPGAAMLGGGGEAYSAVSALSTASQLLFAMCLCLLATRHAAGGSAGGRRVRGCPVRLDRRPDGGAGRGGALLSAVNDVSAQYAVTLASVVAVAAAASGRAGLVGRWVQNRQTTSVIRG